MSDYLPHYSVQKVDILKITSEVLESCDSNYFIDLTFGAGGHTIALAQEFPLLNIVSFDQDLQAIHNGQKNLKSLGLEDRVELIHSNFEDFTSKCEHLKGKCAGILMDLGVSSHRFDEA